MGGGGRKWSKYERIPSLAAISPHVCPVDEFLLADPLRAPADGETRNAVVPGTSPVPLDSVQATFQSPVMLQTRHLL